MNCFDFRRTREAERARSKQCGYRMEETKQHLSTNNKPCRLRKGEISAFFESKSDRTAIGVGQYRQSTYSFACPRRMFLIVQSMTETSPVFLTPTVS